MDYQHTMAINQGPEAPRPDRTPPGETAAQPVFEGAAYGWLVCAEGPFYGSDRPILRAVTYIGAGLEVDPGPAAAGVTLAISYDAESGRFALYRQAGAALLNGAAMPDAVYLNPYDRIGLAGCLLVFVPAYL